MNPPAANDSAADIAAGFEMLARCHRAHLRACGRYVRHVATMEGAAIILCATLGGVAYAVGNARPEPMRSIMAACAVLNGVTVALCLRTAFRSIRDAMAEARAVRAQLREVERDAARFEAARAEHVKTLPGGATLP